MSGSGLSASPLVLVIAVLGYVLKRWWDNADALVERRKEVYDIYFVAAYTLAKDIMHSREDAEAQSIAKSYDEFQAVSPIFLLHASPVAIIVSDEFYTRCMSLRDADRSTWSNQEQDLLVAKLSEALATLREVLKSELYTFQPRFVFERYKYKRRWRRQIREIDKRNSTTGN